MARTAHPYRRLPGTGSGVLESTRLYLGADHLLQVASSGFTERYRRFYFRDIQSITLRKSMHGKVWNIICVLVAFLPGVLAQGASGAARFAWWSVAGIFLLLLALNILRGPTCVCQIRTAVQTRALPSLNRLRRASRVLAQLRPLIAAAQEAMSADGLLQRIEEARRGPAAPLATTPGAG
jgi:hypothetical protein